MKFKILDRIPAFFILLIIFSCKNNSENKVNSIKHPNIEFLVGTYTNDSSEGIYKVILNELGEFTMNSLLAKVENPSYLSLSKSGDFVYAVQENEKGRIFAYQWNNKKDSLIQIGEKSSLGKHPCYVSTNKDNNKLSFANYSTGNVGIIELTKDGRFKSENTMIQHEGSGVVKGRQDAPHAHCSIFKNNNVFYAVDLGLDQIIKYNVKNEQIKTKQIALKSSNGDGFRHLVFHPLKEFSYVVNEFSNSIIVSEIDAETGLFNKIQQISTLPIENTKESFAADIHISKDGKFLYVSNRGHNSISVFSINKNGKLVWKSNTSVEGNWPRNFTISKNNNFVLVANQFSNNITVFKRDSLTGALKYTGNQLEISTPVFISPL